MAEPDPFAGGDEGADPFAAPPEAASDDPFGAPAAEEPPAGDDPFGGGDAAEAYAPMEDAGEPATGGDFPTEEAAAEPAAFPTEEPAAPALDAPVPEVLEIPEENKLTEWLANWKIELEAKNAEHDKATELVKQKAAEELANEKLQKEKQREATQIKNREEEHVMLEKLEADLDAENPWERVVALVDISKEVKEDDGSDVSRMRGILIQLKTESLTSSRSAHVAAGSA
jgi:hypothetical protein